MKKSLITAALLCSMSGVLFAKTLATVNGKAITEKDVDMILGAMPGLSFEVLPEDAKKKVIDQAIERSLLIDLAKKEGIEKSKEYQDALKELKDDLALKVWMKQEFDKIKISDAEKKEFYEKNKERFKQPEMVKASHILVKDEVEAKAVIEELSKVDKNRLKESFAKLANEKSLDKKANENGGSLDWFDEKMMVPEFSKAAFSMEKGTISKEPVKTQFGYHVIYLEDKKPASVVPFEQVSKSIEQNLKMEKFRENTSKKAQELREKAKIEYTK